MWLSAAACRARSATSTGTCITTSSWRSATGRSVMMLSARSASALAAITMTLLTLRLAISRCRLPAASPDPKQIRCGRLSWAKRMPYIRPPPLAAEAAGEAGGDHQVIRVELGDRGMPQAEQGRVKAAAEQVEDVLHTGLAVGSEAP